MTVLNYGEVHVASCRSALEKQCSPTAVNRHVAATMAVFWLPACVREKGLVRSLAPIDRLSLPITATSAGLLPDRGAWDRLHSCLSLRMFAAVWTPLSSAWLPGSLSP
jgi:hypothetical protein